MSATKRQGRSTGVHSGGSMGGTRAQSQERSTPLSHPIEAPAIHGKLCLRLPVHEFRNRDLTRLQPRNSK